MKAAAAAVCGLVEGLRPVEGLAPTGAKTHTKADKKQAAYTFLLGIVVLPGSAVVISARMMSQFNRLGFLHVLNFQMGAGDWGGGPTRAYLDCTTLNAFASSLA
jgi:hypothetical protein